MRIEIPIIITRYPETSFRLEKFAVSGVFIEEIGATKAKLSAARASFVKKVQSAVHNYQKELSHDRLARICFNPTLSKQSFKIRADLGDFSINPKLLFLSFKHHGQRIAFNPIFHSELWFTVDRGEDLQNRASQVLTRHWKNQIKNYNLTANDFRHLEIKHRQQLSIVEVEINPGSLRVLTSRSGKDQSRIGGNPIEGGARELSKVGRSLDDLYPEDLMSALGRDPEIEELCSTALSGSNRPIMLLGPSKSGKTAIVHQFVARTMKKRGKSYSIGRRVWQLTPQRLISGMSYVGQWQERWLTILHEASKRSHVLVLSNFLGFFQAGKSSESLLCLADLLKPWVEKREVTVLTEMTHEQFRVFQERDRRFADMFHIIRIDETTSRKTLEILMAKRRDLELSREVDISPLVLPQIMDLTRRFLPHQGFPGKAVNVLESMTLSVTDTLNLSRVQEKFQAQTGLNSWILNGEQKLERSDIISTLQEQIIGQDEALEAAADVIGIAKARLNDPGRPLASFLFLGPTGVGKTECAKALAAYLFGTEDRLLRFDMNEFTDPMAVARLSGSFDRPEGLLTGAIARQPFTVLLLDEIEKAHPEVFNLLLQVLGEGRLTDALGRTAYFNNTLVIMTSNLGTREAGSGIGFAAESSELDQIFRKAAERFFSPEFFNRIDRIIPFHILDRQQMQGIADHFISRVLNREGLARRQSTLLVDPAAREKIIDQGYHPQLGARALKRSVEKLVARPVARRMAALPPDEMTLIEVLPDQACQSIDVRVRIVPFAKEMISGWELLDKLDPQVLLKVIKEPVSRWLQASEDWLPPGSIDTQTVDARLQSVYETRDLAAALGQEVDSLSERLANPSRSTTRRLFHGGIKSKRRFKRTAVIDLHDFILQMLKDAAPTPDETKREMDHILQKAALHKVMADHLNNPDPPSRIQLRFEPFGEAEKFAELLAQLHAKMLEMELDFGVQLSQEQISGQGSSICLEISGSCPTALLAPIAGTHLLWTREGKIKLVRARIAGPGIPPPKTDHNQLPPVVRVYDSPGPVLDVVTGWLHHNYNQVNFSAWLSQVMLSGLPLPPSLSGEREVD